MSETTAMFEISMNGKHVKTGAATLPDLLLERGYALENAFACAVNSTFVPRQLWPARQLENGDRVDVVTPITGG